LSRTGKKAYEIIRERILNETYAPKEPLVESALAEELGVGRNTIRQALLHLESDKLIELQENRSAIVKYPTKQEVIHLFEIRERLEGLIAYFDAKDLSDEDLNMLKGYIDEMKQYLSQGKLVEYSATNVKFHQVLYDGCTNKEGVKLLKNINLQLRRYKRRTILITGRGDNSCKEHERIFEALCRRDSDAAEAAMRVHISNVRKTLIENYDILY
jgi:DNA-binding GntR family transcriptional regulator